jgi:hypothetical protein
MWTTHSNRKVGKRTAYVFIAKGLIWNKYGCRQGNLSRKLAVWHIVHDFFRGWGGVKKCRKNSMKYVGPTQASDATHMWPASRRSLHWYTSRLRTAAFARYATSRLQCWRTPPLVTPANSPGVRGLAGVWMILICHLLLFNKTRTRELRQYTSSACWDFVERRRHSVCQEPVILHGRPIE